MSRRIEKDGKYFRIRRGKLVQIPPEWVGFRPTHSVWRYCKTFYKRLQRRKERRILKTELFNEISELIELA
jgi:hypothetical protein